MAERKPPVVERMQTLRDLPGSVSLLHPVDEDLLAYHQNRLEREREEWIQDHLADCRDCARNAADLAAFLDASKAAELNRRADGLTAAESQALWRNLEAQRLPAVPPAAPVPWYRRPAVLQAVAAVLLLSTASSVTAWLETRARLQRLENGAVNVVVETVASPGFLRDGGPVAAEPVTVPPGAVVILAPAGDVPAADYDVEITTQDGQVVWSGSGLRPLPPGNGFHLRLPSDLPSGATYRIRVATAGRGQEEVGEVFEVRVGEPARG